MRLVETIATRQCIVCGESTTMDVNRVKLRRWRAGEHVQNVWPDWSAAKRELMITGTHPKCWDVMFAGDNQ